jgi:hypothetical protein
VLDQGRYPTGAQISDEQMKDLEDHALIRHGFHGDWNYSLLPAPRPAPHPRPRPAPQPQPGDLTALNHPALTGLDPAALDALAAALAVPAAAQREQQLYTRRGGQRRRRPNTRPSPRLTLSLTGRILAACLRQHLGLPAAALARMIGADPSTVSEAVKDTRALLAQAGQHVPAGPVRCATLEDLRDYAASHGLILPGPAPA